MNGPKNKINLIGKRFGRLVVIKEGKLHKANKCYVKYWVCKCDCGNIIEVRGGSLRNGTTKSCGCLHRERASESNKKNLVGLKVGLLTVEKVVGKAKDGRQLWLCKCECGNTKILSTSRLTSGRVKSCGCLHKKQKENFGIQATRHGGAKTRLYKIWKSMKKRCYNKKCKDYHNYGGRGITVCDKWKNDFEIFRNWALKNGYKEGLTIDRIDNDGPYAPWNCQFITKSDNSIKSRSNLSPQQVYDIFIYCAAFPNKTLLEIADKFSVSIQPISKIRQGRHPRMFNPKAYVWNGKQTRKVML